MLYLGFKKGSFKKISKPAPVLSNAKSYHSGKRDTNLSCETVLLIGFKTIYVSYLGSGNTSIEKQADKK